MCRDPTADGLTKISEAGKNEDSRCASFAERRPRKRKGQTLLVPGSGPGEGSLHSMHDFKQSHRTSEPAHQTQNGIYFRS